MRKCKHGLSGIPLHYTWISMKQRCNNPNNKRYKNYGGRGIKVCEEWSADFINFYNWAIENGYKENADYRQCTLDRIDVNGNYEPNNCRFITNAEQQNNRTDNKYVFINKEKMTYAQCEKKYNLPRGKVANKLKQGYSIEEIINKIKRNPKNWRKIEQLSLKNEHVKVWDNFHIITKETGMDYRNIHACCNKKQKTAYGYIWRYVDDNS